MTTTSPLSGDPLSHPHDVIVVGARCAGSAAAVVLAEAGRRVLLVDRDAFPSDTLSTHQLFPDSLALLDRLGVGDRLRAAHRLRPARYSWRILGHAVVGGFTPVGGHDRTTSVRRVSLDAALLDAAVAAGADVALGVRVVGLLGSGTDDDPVRGVVLDDGREVRAPWVIGADGRSSTVARLLGLPKEDERRGEMAMMVGYWRGLPDSDVCQIDVREQAAIMSSPCEDDVHLISVSGHADLTRGTRQERQDAYLAAIRAFPGVVNPRLLERAEQLGPVLTVPETMLRGFRRRPHGPGWALVGDAVSFKHPATAQGIGDALAQGVRVAELLVAGGDLATYPAWVVERDAGHYAWSFDAGRFPAPFVAPIYAGLAADPVAGQELLDSFSKRVAPRDVLTPERIARWSVAAVHEAGVAELVVLVEGLDDEALGRRVPACPDWSVADLVAHLVGVAEDAVQGEFYAEAIDAWTDPVKAQAREAWTATQVERRRHLDRERLLRDVEVHGAALVAALRRGANPVEGAPAWGPGAPVADLAAHLADLREALDLPPDTRGPVARFGLDAYRDWFHHRLARQGLPALTLSIGRTEWVVGRGEPVGSLTVDAHELFRVLSGRRTAGAIRALPWSTDPEPYLAVISPYPPAPEPAGAV